MITPEFGHWFAGFTDGEGCFCITKNNNCFITTFTITLREDDKPILEEIQNKIGFGKIHRLASKGNSKPCVTYHIQNKEGALYLCEIFTKYPLKSKKIRDFLIWKEAVMDWATHKRGSGWLKIEELSHKIRDVREHRVGL